MKAGAEKENTSWMILRNHNKSILRDYTPNRENLEMNFKADDIARSHRQL